MKRAVSIISSESSHDITAEERSSKLKRANSSLFSIATLVDTEVDNSDDDSSENIVATGTKPSSESPNKNQSGGKLIPQDVSLVEASDGCAIGTEVTDDSISNFQTSVRPAVTASSSSERGEVFVSSSFVSSVSVSLDCSDALSSCSSSEFFVEDAEALDLSDESTECLVPSSSDLKSLHSGDKIREKRSSECSEVTSSNTNENGGNMSDSGNEKAPEMISQLKNAAPLCLECNECPPIAKKLDSQLKQDVTKPELQLVETCSMKRQLPVVSSVSTLSSETSNKKNSIGLDCRTGLVFEAGSNHFDRHNRFHKERPLRVTSIRDYLLKKKHNDEKTLFERCQALEDGSTNAAINSAAAPERSEDLWLDDDDYLRTHLPGYMQRLDKISRCTCNDRLDFEAEQFKSIYFTSDSVREAKAAAASLCRLVSKVVSGSLDNGFAIIRPPGHHAEPGLAGGYCVINNVAVAAAYARAKLGVKRVLIVDWDVHHGNGTQKIFANDPNVLYFSAHRYHGGNFFPFLDQGGPSYVGAGEGKGFNINVGWNEKKMGDEEYVVLWEKVLMPVATEFHPDLVIVSAGFDAAQGDMGECEITPECFGRLTRRLKTLASGKVVCALEGGYVRSVLCKCVESVLTSLLDSKSDEKSEQELQVFLKSIGTDEMLDLIIPSASRSIKETIRFHSQYWSCLKSSSN